MAYDDGGRGRNDWDYAGESRRSRGGRPERPGGDYRDEYYGDQQGLRGAAPRDEHGRDAREGDWAGRRGGDERGLLGSMGFESGGGYGGGGNTSAYSGESSYGGQAGYGGATMRGAYGGGNYGRPESRGDPSTGSARGDQGYGVGGYGAVQGGQQDWGGQDDWGRGERWADLGPHAGARSHAGRGPKSYRRSDERITEEVCEALTRHPGIDASDVEVRVSDGEVTLGGTVSDRRAKRLAEDIALDVAGVVEVWNEVRVARRDD